MGSVHLSLISYFESLQIDSTNSFHASTYTFLFYMENNNQNFLFVSLTYYIDLSIMLFSKEG